jgi:metallo-beta-lactamase family protein
VFEGLISFTTKARGHDYFTIWIGTRLPAAGRDDADQIGSSRIFEPRRGSHTVAVGDNAIRIPSLAEYQIPEEKSTWEGAGGGKEYRRMVSFVLLNKTARMKITLFGAAGSVTGSAYYLQTKKASVLVDFGVFQGNKTLEARNRKFPPIDVRRLDAVIITHAHLDHCGRLPLLARYGYSGPIYATEATIDVARLILMDSVKVQEHDLKRMNRKRLRMGQSPVEPAYSEKDVQKVFSLFTPIAYNQSMEIAPACRARVREAGHILGSVSIELTVEEEGRKKVILFSGDLGPQGMAIINDPDPFQSADLVFMESTYGDHDHRSLAETLKEGGEIVAKAIAQKGKILVPSFAVGRTQQLLYYLARGLHEGNLPGIPVYLDSPMAIEATKIYLKHKELYDDETVELFREGVFKGDLSGIHVSETAEDSMALNKVEGPCMIIAGAGMCNAGRILHHLRHNLWKPETTVMIVGYQGDGSLGSRLLQGASRVRIFGEEITVKAHIASLGGLSAHAGQGELVSWFGAVAASKPRVVLSHGEDRGRLPLAEIIRSKYGIEPVLPEYGEVVSF